AQVDMRRSRRHALPEQYCIWQRMTLLKWPDLHFANSQAPDQYQTKNRNENKHQHSPTDAGSKICEYV
ncbi:MAG: hypothetical protein KGM99_09880, partial [Burkholderiales bacterium]|nr:hypothetical protein [Burkholderiales bacterium]